MPNTIPGDPLKSLAQFGSWFEKRKHNKLKKEENDIREEGNNIAKEGNKTQEDRNDIYSKQNNLSNLRTNIDNMYSENSATAGHAVEEIFKTIDYYLEEYKDTGDLKYQNEAQSLLNKVCLYARNAGNSKGDNLHENDTCNTIAEQINTRFIAAQKNNHDWESLDIDLHGAFFSENISLEKIKSAGNINLNGCTFQKGLNLKLAHSKIGENDYLTHDPISLSNCTFGGDLNIHGGSYSIAQEINLKNNTFTNGGKLDIGGLSAVKNGRLPITIEGDSMPHDILFTSVISPTIQIGSNNKGNLKKIEISGEIVVKNCENADFNIYNHTVNGSLKFIPEDKTSTYRTNTVENIYLESSEIKGTLIIGTLFKSSRYEKIKNIEIIGSTINEGLHINAEDIERIWFEYVDFLIEGKALHNSNDVESVDFVNSTKIEFYNIRKIGTLHLHQVNFYAPLRIDATQIDKFHLSATNFYVIKPHVEWGNHGNQYCLSCFRITFNGNKPINHAISVISRQDGYKLDS